MINDIHVKLNKNQEKRDVTYGRVKKILVIGAGVAGVVAAVEAAFLGYEVVLIESQKDLLSLQGKVTHRYVGPFMYEWPAFESNNQNYPPNIFCGVDKKFTPRWDSSQPMLASEFAKKFICWFNETKTKISSTLRVDYNFLPTKIEEYVKKFIEYQKNARKIVQPSLILSNPRQ